MTRTHLTPVGLGLATAILFAACGGTASPAPATPAGGGGGGGEEAVIQDFTLPAVTAKVGDTVSFTNKDSATHTATADDGSFDSGNIAQDAAADVTFQTAGTFPYHCEIHSSMTGTITVTE